MSATFTERLTETFHIVSCYTCGVRFGIDERIYRRVVTEAEGSIYCPACGKLTCWRESEQSKQIKELERKLAWEAANAARQKEARDAAEAALKSTEASLRATKGIVTKVKKRVANATCPCCNRHFPNDKMAKHIATKHPDFSQPPTP